MKFNKTLIALLVIAALLIPFLLNGQNPLVDEIAGQIFDKMTEITVIDKAIELITLKGETLEQAYNDITKLWTIAYNKWRGFNRSYRSAEAIVTGKQMHVATAKSQYKRDAQQYHDCKEEYMIHTAIFGRDEESKYLLEKMETAHGIMETSKTKLIKEEDELKEYKNIQNYYDRKRSTQVTLMSKYDEARIGLYIKLEPYLKKKAEKYAEIRAIVVEVLGDIPEKVAEMESKIEELKKSDQDKSQDINDLKQAIETLKGEVGKLQERLP